MIREYLEFYRMDYTLSVFLPEVAMQGQQHHVSRDQLAESSGVLDKSEASSKNTPLLVQMMQLQAKQKKQAEESKPPEETKE